MKYYLCSISFRHELVSLNDLIHYAHNTGFDGIELWGIHAKALLRDRGREIPLLMDTMEFQGLGISMISEYMDLCANDDQDVHLLNKWEFILSMAKAFRTNKIRIFAGNQPSEAASLRNWEKCVERLRLLARIASEHGMYIVIETHPNTFADTLESTIRLLQDTQHTHVKINLDFIHMWESGCEPLDSYRALKKWVVNYHVKNVLSLDRVELFAPSNVFSPSGSRTGMTALSEGAIDYKAIISHLEQDGNVNPIAIEWFGNKPFLHLAEELAWLRGKKYQEK
jgi:3-dehydroshikimate dehydratase